MLALYLSCLLITSLANALPWKEAKFDRRNEIRNLLHDVSRLKEREGYNAEGESEKQTFLSDLESEDLRRLKEVLHRAKSDLEEKNIKEFNLTLQQSPKHKRRLLRERKDHQKLQHNQRRKPPKKDKNKGRKSEKYYLENPKVTITLNSQNLNFKPI
ncbi:unnamed protein product [Mytilus edulis]|uniref:Uncharacterized protein n=1 Tax=Mytilus edulis TaxID=6550 RepID=A0A8S3TPA6_MYTED|nr:unnamed protein product [Mytilus edulis]